MSTAGKVLTVLILLVMIGWLVMASAVTQLNVNWEQKLIAQRKDFDKATADVAKATADTIRLTEAARVEQQTTDRDLREVLAQIVALERRVSSKTEDLTRVKAELADYQKALEDAKANLANREAEKVKGEADLARRRDEIAKAQVSNSRLRAELAQLQDDFKRLLARNTEAAAKAAQKGPATKPASSRRDSPAS